MSLTDNQRNTLAIVYSKSRRGYGCTSFDLRQAFGLSDSASAARLATLRKKGLIEYGGLNRFRSQEAPHQLTEAGRRELIW